MQEILNRHLPPLASPLKQVNLPAYSQKKLSNGIPVYMLNYGTAEVVQVKMVFKAGSAYQQKVGQANYTARNMQEGTMSYSSLELAQKLDGYGAWIGHEIGESSVTMQLTTLSNRLSQTLPLLKEVICTPIFPEEEFEKMKQRNLQKLQVSSQKTSFHARRNFGHYLYGKNHPYGIHLGKSELEQLQLEDLTTYYQKYIQPSNAFFIVVGQFEEEQVINQLENHFSLSQKHEFISEISNVLSATISSHSGRRHHKIEGMQSTVRLGHLGFKRSHEDFYAMQVVNTVLGGYFGSRLMKNIREEKGYTYGIYSAWISYKYRGHFVVQGDVGNEYVENTIEEVKKEMKKLMETTMSQEELDLVKNYLLGKNISQRETPFQLADIIRFSVVNGISFEELDRKFQVIQSIQVEDIQQLAQAYLKPENMLEVVAGA